VIGIDISKNSFHAEGAEAQLAGLLEARRRWTPPPCRL